MLRAGETATTQASERVPDRTPIAWRAGKDYDEDTVQGDLEVIAPGESNHVALPGEVLDQLLDVLVHSQFPARDQPAAPEVCAPES